MIFAKVFTIGDDQVLAQLIESDDDKVGDALELTTVIEGARISAKMTGPVDDGQWAKKALDDTDQHRAEQFYANVRNDVTRLMKVG